MRLDHVKPKFSYHDLGITSHSRSQHASTIPSQCSPADAPTIKSDPDVLNNRRGSACHNAITTLELICGRCLEACQATSRAAVEAMEGSKKPSHLDTKRTYKNKPLPVNFGPQTWYVLQIKRQGTAYKNMFQIISINNKYQQIATNSNK